MNPNTGAIALFETDEDADAAGYTERLTAKEARHLRQFTNRHERRAELSRMRKAAKQARRTHGG